MRIVFTIVILLSFAGTAVAQCDEDLDRFYPEMDRILLQAHKNGNKKVVVRLRTNVTTSDKGDRTKAVFTFLNDSVIEYRCRWSKSYRIVRNESIYYYIPPKKKQQEYPALVPVDSAGYEIYWGTRAMGDTSRKHVSYCRMKFDSLNRQTDYYFSINDYIKHDTWKYEGDSVTWYESFESHGDSMRKVNALYFFRYVNPDSTFRIEVIKSSMSASEIVFPYRKTYSESKTYITYDELHRISVVTTEESTALGVEVNNFCTRNTMKVAYK